MGLLISHKRLVCDAAAAAKFDVTRRFAVTFTERMQRADMNTSYTQNSKNWKSRISA